MIPKYAREEMKEALPRISALADEALETLRGYSPVHPWSAAVDATLAIHRGPKHLLRAQLVLLGSMAGGGAAEGKGLERFAASMELLHLFMLLHDDVMDNATIRRGKSTLRLALQQADPKLEWQTARDMAILLGTTVSMLAVQRMLPLTPSAGLSAACDLILEACFHAGAGQFQDLLGHRALIDGETGLRRVLVDKVAYHAFAAPFAAGLLIASHDAGLPAEQIEATKSRAMRWGEHIGVAFQATDDLVDLIAPPSVTGKDGLKDLLLGRPSLPLLLLRDRAAEDDVAFVDSIAGKRVVDMGERAALADILERNDIAGACAERIRREVASAAAVADEAGFPPAAREGMRVFESRLLEYATETIEEAREAP